MKYEYKTYAFDILPLNGGDSNVYLEDIGDSITFISNIYYLLCLAHFRDPEVFSPIRQNLIVKKNFTHNEVSRFPKEFRIEPISISYGSPWTVVLKAILEIYEHIEHTVLLPFKAIQEYYNTKQKKQEIHMKRIENGYKIHELEEKRMQRKLQDESILEIMKILATQEETKLKMMLDSWEHQQSMHSLERLDRTIEIVERLQHIFPVPDEEKTGNFLPIGHELVMRLRIDKIINPRKPDEII